MNKSPDILVSRILTVAILLILAIWIWNGLTLLWELYMDASQTGSVWSGLWKFFRENLSIFVVIYGVICLQVSGIAELKFEKHFLKALILALLLTPPVMMGVFGRRAP